jgi:hypothetical protein
LPELVTITEAISVSPTYDGSPEIAKPDPPEEVKFAEERESPEYSATRLVSSRDWLERTKFPRQERNSIASDM